MYTKKDHAESLNELPVPFGDLKSNGGRIPDAANYGDWMRRHDPIAFNVSYQETKREHAHRERSKFDRMSNAQRTTYTNSDR